MADPIRHKSLTTTTTTATQSARVRVTAIDEATRKLGKHTKATTTVKRNPEWGRHKARTLTEWVLDYGVGAHRIA